MLTLSEEISSAYQRNQCLDERYNSSDIKSFMKKISFQGTFKCFKEVARKFVARKFVPELRSNLLKRSVPKATKSTRFNQVNRMIKVGKIKHATKIVWSHSIKAFKYYQQNFKFDSTNNR